MPKIDRRIRRTRRSLGEALRELVVEKPYDTITIRDITDRADLNRATFYLHYDSKEALLMASLEGQFEELVARINEQSSGGRPWEDPSATQVIFDYAAENAALFKVLLGEQGQGHVMYRILQYITAIDQHEIEELAQENPVAIPVPILARHFAGSLYSLITWWLENDMPYSSNTMAVTVQQLCSVGVMPVLAEMETA